MHEALHGPGSFDLRMRRIPSLIVVAAILVGAVWSIWQWARPRPAATDPWTAVPDASALVIELPGLPGDWERITGTSQLWHAMDDAPAVPALDSLVVRLADAVKLDGRLRSALEDTPPLVVLIRTGGGFGTLAVLPFPDKVDPAVFGAVGQALGAGPVAGERATGRPHPALPDLHIATRKGLLLVADHADALEESLLHLDAGGAPDGGMQQARLTWGAGSDAHLLIHAQRGARLLDRWLLPDAMGTIDAPDAWIALDLRSRPEQVLLGGSMSAIDGVDHADAQALRDVLHVLPEDAVAFQACAVEGADDLHPVATAPDSLQDALLSWVHGLVTWAITDQGDGLMLMGAADTGEAVRRIGALCPSGCDTASHRGVLQLQLPVAGLHEAVLGPDREWPARPWCAVLDEQVVFSDRREVLERTIDAWRDGQVLARSERARRTVDGLSGDAVRTMWCDVARSRPWLKGLLRAEAAARMDSAAGIWDRFGAFSLQLLPTRHGDRLVSLVLEHDPLGRPLDRALWTAGLGDAPEAGPWLVKDHTTGALQVLVQDAQHRLHLFGSTGKALWTHPLDGPVMGGVHQVDRYRNGKLQLLFNTAGQVHLIDRLGRDVEDFPVKLKEPASAPIALFDYDGRRDYRILVPITNGSLLNLGIDGRPVKGWEAKAGAPAVAAPAHVRIKSKDYLVVVRQDGGVQALDRQGGERHTVELRTPGVIDVLRVRPGLGIGTTRVIWRDSLNTVFSGTLDGVVDTLAVGGKAWLTDVDADGERDLLVLQHGRLSARQGNEPLWEVAVEGSCEIGPVPNGGTLVSEVDRDRVRWIRTDGSEPLPPMEGGHGAAAGDLNLDGRVEVVTVSRSGNVQCLPLEPR